MPRETISVWLGGGGHSLELVTSRMRSTKSRSSRNETWTVGLSLLTFMSCNVYQGVARRKYISWKTKYAAALLKLGDVPYSDAKLMTEDQIISLYRVDHNILHETGHPLRDSFWNLTPMLILAHKEKTRQDATVIAKGRRIRAWNERKFSDAVASTPTLRIGSGESKRRAGHGVQDAAAPRPTRTLRSRGFDKRYRKKMDGTVVKR